MVQTGRDRHNSAFFAGCSGLFRRGPLEEIGGFQPQTITEDLHTSLILHSRGYQSRYLNKILSVGLMPETLDGYLKQRTRWAIGSMQVLLRNNPLTIRGLTVAQRIDYFGSIFYFFFGIPRVICLLAPLAMLLFPAFHRLLQHPIARRFLLAATQFEAVFTSDWLSESRLRRIAGYSRCP